ncbi:MAG: hypothetical protein ACTHMM_25315 [Agriterribacter sp.]
MHLPTYIINLKTRIDRHTHIQKEFAGRNEFSVSIIEACEHKQGSIGLWESIKKVVHIATENDFEYFLLCEDDHQFTEKYNFRLLHQCIDEAIKLDTDVLCGGVSWFEDGFPISEKLFWVRKFSGLQFTVIFKKMYGKILNADFKEHEAADYKISGLAINNYFIHPFISTQKEFGYSDVTERNNGADRVEALFATTENNARIIKDINSFYKGINNNTPDNTVVDFDTLAIPTYIINLPERTERREHIIDQFNGKKEFDITIINAFKHNIGAVGLWDSIRKIINMAIKNDDDVIIICEDDHEFTSEYCKDFLLKNIIEAHEQGCEYLNCGTGKFDFAVPVSPYRFWINQCLSTQFIVLYRKFFQRILEEPYDDTVTADRKLSEMSRHKMVLYPFISLQHDFGYSDVTPVHNEQKHLVKNMFALAQRRLQVISKEAEKHKFF